MRTAIFVSTLLLSGCNLPCLLQSHAKSPCVTAPSYTPHPPFPAGGRTFPYYTTAPNGPAVIVLHELPGATPEFIRFTDLLYARGYTVYAPLFFGRFGCSNSRWRNFRVTRGKDFAAGATAPSKELVAWLREFTAKVRAESGGGKVAMIGMCLTGSLPLYVMDTNDVAAVVLSQPSLPSGLFHRNSRAINVDPLTLVAARRSGVPILAMRFEKDCLSTANRFYALRSTFPPAQMETIELPSHHENAHAILTGEYHPNGLTGAATECVFSFLDHHLAGRTPPPVVWPNGDRRRCGAESVP